MPGARCRPQTESRSATDVLEHESANIAHKAHACRFGRSCRDAGRLRAFPRLRLAGWAIYRRVRVDPAARASMRSTSELQLSFSTVRTSIAAEDAARGKRGARRRRRVGARGRPSLRLLAVLVAKAGSVDEARDVRRGEPGDRGGGRSRSTQVAGAHRAGWLLSLAGNTTRRRRCSRGGRASSSRPTSLRASGRPTFSCRGPGACWSAADDAARRRGSARSRSTSRRATSSRPRARAPCAGRASGIEVALIAVGGRW